MAARQTAAVQGLADWHARLDWICVTSGDGRGEAAVRGSEACFEAVVLELDSGPGMPGEAEEAPRAARPGCTAGWCAGRGVPWRVPRSLMSAPMISLRRAPVNSSRATSAAVRARWWPGA